MIAQRMSLDPRLQVRPTWRMDVEIRANLDIMADPSQAVPNAYNTGEGVI